MTASCAIGSAIVLADIASHVITEPATRNVEMWRTWLWVLALLWTARTLGNWAQARLSQRGAAAAIAELSTQVLASVTARSPHRLTVERDAAAAVVTRGLDTLRPYFTAYLPALLQAAILTPATVAVIACFDRRATVLVVLTLPLIPVFMALIGMATAERSAAALAAMTTLQSRVLDLIAGLPTLRALGRASGPEHRIAELSAAHRRSTMGTLRIAFLSALAMELLATLSVAVVAVSIGLRLVTGAMSLMAGLTVLLLVPDVYWPLRRIGLEFHNAEDGRAAAAKAFDLIGEQRPATGRQTVTARGGVISLDRVSVASRDGSTPADLTAVIEPAQITVLTGANGAGKSTALMVIAGLTTPSSGRVSVAGFDVADLDLPSWWRQLAWLPPRPMLIPGSVADNLALFGDLVDPDVACAEAGFDAVLADLPHGADTTVGRGGVGLSQGQRHRLGLARVLGSAAPVLLLDEPTAHLDAATEQRVLGALAQRAHAGATVVVVSHRAPTLSIADQVITVHKQGAHPHAWA